MKASVERVGRIVKRLGEEYGSPVRGRRPTPLETLIKTILSQNTSDTNSLRAYDNLCTAFSGWEEVSQAQPEAVFAAIKTGGLGDIKSRRIIKVLGEIKRRHGGLSLGFLADMPLAEARRWLTGLSGVGPKTAACVLLFSLDMPALPVDTHVLRVAKRLGLVELKASADAAHHILEDIVPSKLVYPFHLLLIEHGRRVCKAARPLCDQCAVAELCPSRKLC